MQLWQLLWFRPWLWFTISRDENLADRRDGHGDTGTRFSLTFSAGPSAAPLRPADVLIVLCWSECAPTAAVDAAAGAAGAAGAAAPPSAASAAAAEGGPGGACATGDD
jgi:hypothetical protein